MDTKIRGDALARHAKGQAIIRGVLLGMGSFLLGAATAAWWFHGVVDHGSSSRRSETTSQGPSSLSESTKTILNHLNSPVEVRFYSVLEPGTANDSLRSFAGRVDSMLKQYQQSAPGKLQVRRFEAGVYTNAGAATADRIKPIDTENGNPSSLGIAVAQGERKQTLARLEPEWEVALEADLSRAIDQVSQPAAMEPPITTPQATATAEEVKRLLPNYSSLSLEEGTRTLRQTALNQFKDAATEIQKQLQDAEQALTRAQATGSALEQQAAMKHLQQLQSEQTDRLKQIAANSQAQIEALRRLKAAAP